MYNSVSTSVSTTHSNLFVTTDSEWDSHLSEPWISTAFHSDLLGTTVFFRDDIPDETREVLDRTAREIGVELKYLDRRDDTDPLERYGAKGKIRLVMFFSPKDVEYAVGWNKFSHAIDGEKVRQNKNLSGRIGQTVIKDVCGWAGKDPLVKFTAGLGVAMINKESMDEYKARMWEGLIEKPADFLRYAVDDATMLSKAHTAFIELFNTVQKQHLGMTDAEQWTPEDIPMTVGALVAKTFEKWLYSQAGDYKDTLKFCIRKLGILDPDCKRHKHNLKSLHHTINKYHSFEAIEAEKESDKVLKHFLKGCKFMSTALDGCSVKWWRSRPITESGVYNALVQGGRCHNENPFEYKVDRGLDVDISGCYGASLRSLVYPIGLPTVWNHTPNEIPITLGTWLDRNQEGLIDGLWSATVSGELAYEQDLIYSKLATPTDVQKGTPDDDDTDIHSDFVMLRQQIVNGIITSDVLKTLKAVCTNTEWAKIRKLELVTGCAYLRQDRQEGLQEWCEHILKDQQGYETRENGDTCDDRSRAWFGTPLEGFVGKLVDRRAYYKKHAKDESLPQEERVRAIGLDATMKLLVNTLYGVKASRFFKISNTVLANCITARARVGVWMLAKSLGTRQSITDGGMYTPDRVCAWNDRKPGLDTLSRQWEWEDSRKKRRTYVPMGELNWNDMSWKSIPTNVDELALHHVNEFWKPYGLSLPFALEHKLCNTFSSAAYWSKADYSLTTERKPEEPVYAVRGKDKNKRTDVKLHPTFSLLDTINRMEDVFPSDLTYSKGGILKIGKYMIIQSCKGYENAKHLRPGDNLPVEVHIARYNNTHFPMMNVGEYEKRRNRKKNRRGEPFQWFERYGNEGISGVHSAMKSNSLRD